MNQDRDSSGERRLIERAREEARALTEAEAALRRNSPGAPPDPPPDAPPPNSFPGYRIVRELQRGGQGVVYEAIQHNPHRTVAIKVLRATDAEAGTRDVARFEREIQILAGLKHRNVVAIHDSGEASGSFYYVMDYIGGLGLDDHVAAAGLPARGIVEILIKVCDAVNAGHLRGVIHRDLKPANIRVDTDGEPHVLDFGLAKISTSAAATTGGPDPMRMSLSGQFIGSLPWASPEQAAGRPQEVDTRTDVYALGVILFHALTGRFPYAIDGTARDVLDRIIGCAPISPRNLRRDIDSDLETIVLKCLSKAPERRYHTAGDLGRDLRRSLAGQPIEARRDSGWYLLRKYLERHRLLAAAVAVFVMLTAAALLTFSAQRESQRRRASDAAQLLASVGDLSALQAAADPFSPEVPTPYDLRQLEGFASWIESQAPSVPQVEARLRTTLGLGYLKLREYERAEPHLARALSIRELSAAPPRDVADSLHNLGRALFASTKYTDAAACYARAIDLRQALFGEESLELADSCNDLAQCLMRLGRPQDAERQSRRALQMRQALLGEQDRWVIASQNNLATCLAAQGRHEEALPLFQAAHAWVIAQEDINELFVVRSLRSVAGCLAALGRFDEALPLAEQAASRAPRLPGDPAPEIALCELRLAECRRGLGDLVEAERLCRSALSKQQAGPRSRQLEVAEAMALLSRILEDAGRADEAARWAAEASRIRAEGAWPHSRSGK